MFAKRRAVSAVDLSRPIPDPESDSDHDPDPADHDPDDKEPQLYPVVEDSPAASGDGAEGADRVALSEDSAGSGSGEGGVRLQGPRPSTMAPGRAPNRASSYGDSLLASAKRLHRKSLPLIAMRLFIRKSSSSSDETGSGQDSSSTTTTRMTQ